MGKIQWNLWARAWVIGGCWTGVMFAVPLMFYTDDENAVSGPILAYYLWAVSVVLFPFFWPIKQLGALRILTASHVACFIICLLVTPFCFVRQPGVITGCSWGIAAILFLVGAIRKEKTETLDELRGKAPAR